MIGSSGFPINAALGAQIVDLIRAFPPRAVILTRGRGNVDEFVAHVALALGYQCLIYPSRGGADNWDRDVELVRDADEVIAILASASLRDTNSGTAHLMEKCLDQRKPLRAFTEVGDTLVYAGASDD